MGIFKKNIETAKKVKMENCGKTWWKVQKAEKSGGKWENWQKFEKWKNLFCETLENLSKNEKILKRQKRENWKIGKWQNKNPGGKWTKSEKPGGKWKNLAKVWKVEKF